MTAQGSRPHCCLHAELPRCVRYEIVQTKVPSAANDNTRNDSEHGHGPALAEERSSHCPADQHLASLALENSDQVHRLDVIDVIGALRLSQRAFIRLARQFIDLRPRFSIDLQRRQSL